MAKKRKSETPLPTRRWALCQGLRLDDNRELAAVFGDGTFIRPGIVEIFGRPSGGKSALAYHLGALYQKAGGVFVMVDWELSWDDDWAARLGVDTNNVVHIPLHRERDDAITIIPAEEVYDGICSYIVKLRRELPDAPVWILTDSFADIMPEERASVEAIDDVTMRTRLAVARWAAEALPRLNFVAMLKGVTWAFVNQVRQDLNKPAISPYVDTTRTPGGFAFEHKAATRVRVKTTGKIKKSGQVVGIKGVCQNEKNKLGPPYRSIAFKLYFDGTIEFESSG